MTKAMDILKELEDIGAVGDKIQQPTIRRAVPIKVPLVIEVSPPPPSRIQTHKALSGFAEQLETLEEALHGMLEWCTAAREELLASEDLQQDEPEAPEAPEAVDEAAETEVEAESAATPVPPEAPPPAAKPRLSLEEIRKHFLDPTFQAEAEKPNGNGASTLEVPAVPTPETEKANG